MGLEQPKFEDEQIENSEDSNSNIKHDNVIQGPWPARKLSPEEPEEFPSDPERKDNLIPGPWPKREIIYPEDPVEKPKEYLPLHLVPDNAAQIEKAKKELDEIANRNKKESIQTKPKDPGGGGESRRIGYSEVGEKPKVCEFCRGSGRS